MTQQTTAPRHTFRRNERIKSRKAIEALFAGKRDAMTCWPMRVIYLKRELSPDRATADILVSVPKRKLKHAVDRNRVKRVVREAYRLNKHILTDKLEGKGVAVSIAFILLAAELPDTATVMQRVRDALTKIGERLC